jgi:hypothetical protein
VSKTPEHAVRCVMTWHCARWYFFVSSGSVAVDDCMSVDIVLRKAVAELISVHGTESLHVSAAAVAGGYVWA